MRTFNQVNLSLLALAASTVAQWYCQVCEYNNHTFPQQRVTPSIIPTPISSISSVTTDTETVTTAAAIDNSESDLTIAITNSYGTQLSLSFGQNSGGPTAIGNPGPTALANAASTQYSFPTGWAGRVGIGPNLNPNNSKIEGSYINGTDIDVSYVDGYSVPIICTAKGNVVSGCNIELFEQQNIICDTPVAGPVCLNSAIKIRDNGPPPIFFQACAGKAYTYSNDNMANNASIPSTLITCCIGKSCEAPL